MMAEDGSDQVSSVLKPYRGAAKESQWLADRGLIRSPDSVYTLQVVDDWHMPGSETYIFGFTVNSEDLALRAIVKACIKMNPTATVDEWMRRRQRLQDYGVEVPRLYARSGGEYIEEHIEHDLSTLQRSKIGADREELDKSKLNTLRIIKIAGFNLLSSHDLRSRGDDVVVVDFGSDLGDYKI